VAVREAVDLVDLALKATTAYQRPDLGERLRVTRERLAEPAVRVLVVGEFKQGKSQLVNALLGLPVCPVDDDVATSVPTIVRHAETPSATLVYESGERREAPVEKLAEYVSEAGNPGNAGRLRHADVGVPRKLLADGLVLVDTPGVGGLGSAHGAVTMAALPTADAVLLVSDAAQSYTRPELDFLDAAMRLCPNVACVVTKTDLYRHWREITETDRAALAAARIDAEVFPVSSTLRLHAISSKSQEVNAESGFPELTSFLTDRVLAEADRLDRRSASQDVLAVCEQISTGMRSELEALENPEGAERLVAELEAAKGRAAELKERAARWQNTLNDGVTDLTADVDHDLRDRLRGVLREAEQTLDDEDPAKIWEQFSEWVTHQVSAAASASFVSATERARDLAVRVAEHFASGGTAVLPKLRMGSAEDAQQRAAALDQPKAERLGLGGGALAGLRGGYIGGLMFGMLANFAMAGLGGPVGVGAGLLMGGKGIKDEAKRRLEQRRAEAKAAVRKHIDDVVFQVGKDCKDMLRDLQRTLRDHFTAHAEQLQNSVNESLRAAQQAASTSRSERDRRIRDLRAELGRVDGLAEQARRLAGEASRQTGGAGGQAQRSIRQTGGGL
jgi:replication fork clamp-binding protein CrfC